MRTTARDTAVRTIPGQATAFRPRALTAALLLALAAGLAACDRGPAAPADDAPTAAAPAAPTIGIDLAGLDKSVQPGDDFEAYANGTWR